MKKLYSIVLFLISLSILAGSPPKPEGCFRYLTYGPDPKVDGINGWMDSTCKGYMEDPSFRSMLSTYQFNERQKQAMRPQGSMAGQYPIPQRVPATFMGQHQFATNHSCLMVGANCMQSINQDPRFQFPGIVNPISRYPENHPAYSPMAPASATFR